MNLITVDDKNYDMDKLSEAAQRSCVLLAKSQHKAMELAIDLDIIRSASEALSLSIKEQLTEDAIVEDEPVPTED